ncbi:MAG: protein translocase subunit SecD [Planctomycetales bacterium]|nr:protein translocase subunit SecD [Planctomycetales bacterium]
MDGIAQFLLLSRIANDAGVSAWMGREALILTMLALVVTVPFLMGELIARLLRLPDLSHRIGVVLMTISMSLSPFAFEMLRGQSWTNALHFGIDLAGGTNLVYQIDTKEAQAQKKVVNKATVSQMVDAIKKRVNPSGTIDMTVRGVGTDRIEVIVPGVDRDLVEQMKAKITRLGSLEFGILANRVDHPDLVKAAEALPKDQRELFVKERVVAAWRDASQGKEKDTGGNVGSRVVTLPNAEGKDVEVLQFLIKQELPDQTVTGYHLTQARAQLDNNGRPAVGFHFNGRGAFLFGNLTQANLPDSENGPTQGFRRRLAILLDGKVCSAPTIQSRITSAGEITGSFTMKEVEELVAVLNAGALEVPLNPTPISEFTISPLLGSDVRQKGVTAILISTFCVFGFMLVYYRVAGVVADLSLALNLLMVVGAMAFISATFTLPGLAGIVLTIGMAVDSNVLIYERMREELARGANLRIAIQNGFERAFSAIFDGNVTSLLTAAILYMIGSDLIRGFAVSLFIGLLMSLFSCLYFGHLALEIIDRKRMVKTIKMMQFLGETNIDFLSKRGVAFAGSGLLIAAGMAALFVRGSANMDIDFSGGTMVTFQFIEKQSVDDVRARLNEVAVSNEPSAPKVFPEGVSLEQLTADDEQQSVTNAKRFRMRTPVQDQLLVSSGINKAFDDAQHALFRVTLADSTVAPITDKLEGNSQRFEGGNQTVLTFSEPVSEATVIEYLSRELSAIKTDKNRVKYESVQLLLSASGPATEKPAAKEKADAARKAGTKVESSPKFTEFTVRTTRQVIASDLDAGIKSVQARLAASPVFEEVNAFETSVANNTKVDALLAIIASLVMIVVYMWFRFEKVYFGYAAVAALAHDVLVTVGCIALGAYLSKTPIGPLFMLDDFKINLNQIACLLTIVGYSLNDTIVIFDRIREIKGKNPKISYEMINQSVNQTLSRTLLTALTTFVVVLVLYIAGGEGIHGFAFSMIIGVVTGCYSTIYIANPVLLWLVQHEAQPAKTVLARR